MSSISTHVLDTSSGTPAAGLPITLESQTPAGWKRIGGGTTNADGRVASLLDDEEAFGPGRYRMSFQTGEYFETNATEGFYPVVRIEFEVRAVGEHYHVPLLLSPYGYSTYRGS